MSLYRKYRPKNFSEVFGQDHIVKTLINQISTGSASHAYLFCGTRGTGKTSVARLLARSLNCTSDLSNNIPCNSCHVCLDILENRSMNVIEIDAASNNGVDNIRELLEEVRYPPVSGKYKIYIIDEVHMLSTGAFNALLKTLEEPPEHVVFILATTDPHKVLPTIHSRCQRFDFKRIPSSEIAKNIMVYLELENVQIEPSAVDLVAQLADGSVRDALSLCDQILAFFTESKITQENVRQLVGSVDTTFLFDMTYALLKKDSLATIEIIHNITQASKDCSQFTIDLIAHFRNLIVAKLVNAPNQVLDVTKETLESLANQSSQASAATFSKLSDTFTAILPKMRTEKNPKILLEITCLKLCIEEDIEAPIPKIEKSVEKTIQTQKKEQTQVQPQVQSIVQPQVQQSFWGDFIASQDSMLKAILANCKFSKQANTVHIESDNDITHNVLISKESELAEKIATYTKEQIELKIHKQNKPPLQNTLTQDQQQEIQQIINMPIEFV